MGLEINRPYFIICALILENSQMKPIKNIVKRISEEISSHREITELHANNMSWDKNIHVNYDDSENNRYLQIVDILANTVFAKYNFNKTYFYDQVSDKILYNVFYPEKFDIENDL